MSGFCLVHHNDYYHMFYTYFPHAIGTGGRGDGQARQYWNHARSKNLVYWEDQPMAIWPSIATREHICISGTVVISDEGVPTIIIPVSVQNFRRKDLNSGPQSEMKTWSTGESIRKIT